MLTDTHTVTVEQSFAFDIGGKLDGGGAKTEDLVSGFNFGATWEWSNSKAVATAVALSKPDNVKNDCGY